MQLQNRSLPTYKGKLLKSCKIICTDNVLTLSRMCIFRAADGWGDLLPSLPKICHTYRKMMKLGTVIPYLRKIKKMYE